MQAFNKYLNTKDEYDGCRLRYTVDFSDKTFEKINEKYFEQMKAALDEVGVYLNLEGNELQLTLNPYKYIRVKNRGAGRREKCVWKSPDLSEGTYKYSDIVLMLQTMKDQDIADQLGMPIATYYRHKKKLKESTYYKNLDPERLSDIEYLENLDGNLNF